MENASKPHYSSDMSVYLLMYSTPSPDLFGGLTDWYRELRYLRLSDQAVSTVAANFVVHKRSSNNVPSPACSNSRAVLYEEPPVRYIQTTEGTTKLKRFAAPLRRAFQLSDAGTDLPVRFRDGR